MEPHIQHIYPAARIMAESYMELPDLNCTRSDVRAYIHQARRRFEENCKNTFFLLPLTKMHLFKPTAITPNTPPTSSSANSLKDLFTQISPVPKKEIKSTKSASESDDDENDSDKSEIVFSYKEQQEILEEAARMAKVPEQQRVLIKIITATRTQSPIQERNASRKIRRHHSDRQTSQNKNQTSSNIERTKH
jgi:hypothetical protein